MSAKIFAEQPALLAKRRSHQQRQFAQDFVERQSREERQCVLDHQPLLRCERPKFDLIARSAPPGV
jgi:hypothetical protein